VRTGSLRWRVTAMVLGLLVLVLGVVIGVTTVAYRGSLEGDLRHRVTSGAKALREAARDDPTREQLVRALALEGIDVQISASAPPAPAKAGGRPVPVKASGTASDVGGLIWLRERLPGQTVATLTASRAGIDGQVERLLVIEIVVALGALALVGVLLLRGTRVALRPLEHVAAVAERIADGCTHERLRPSRTDTELGRMAGAFDRMVSALEDALAQARASEESTRRFLADASHELRTPIAAVQATAETLLREQPERPERDALETRLAGDAARLGRLVADLLSLARLDAADPLRRDAVDLAGAARAAAAESAVAAHGLQMDLRLDEAAYVRGDREALTRTLRNLMDNAVAVSPPGGRIVVTVRRSAEGAETRVTDQGPGVPPAERERIFERFARLGAATERTHAGLGLAIARRIARRHGGELTCDPVEHGACFTLRLPIAAG
jgi:two-component system, OmpR family, sensor kinase